MHGNRGCLDGKPGPIAGADNMHVLQRQWFSDRPREKLTWEFCTKKVQTHGEPVHLFFMIDEQRQEGTVLSVSTRLLRKFARAHLVYLYCFIRSARTVYFSCSPSVPFAIVPLAPFITKKPSHSTHALNS